MSGGQIRWNMAVWAIADIHASKLDPRTGKESKPMDIFGNRWENHVARIESAWLSNVHPEDTVIVAGDIDWALHLEDAMETLERLDRLPGRKVLVRGNHDYWWSSKTTGRVRKRLPESISVIHNDSVTADGFNICGTKGSPVPGGPDWTPENEKLLNREYLRLNASLESRDSRLPTIVAMHFPPTFPSSGNTLYSALLENAGVQLCVYGHLHGTAASAGPHGQLYGVCYLLVAADAVDFRPVLIEEHGEIVPSRTGPMRTRAEI